MYIYIYIYIYIYQQNLTIPVAARSKVYWYGRWLVGIAGSIRARVMDVCCECCVLGSGLCNGPIPHTEKSYRVCLCFGNELCSGATITLYTYSALTEEVGTNK
jgi:hypothetical protein